MKKQAIVVVSFGTSHKDTREKTIQAIEQALAGKYPQRECRRAFTSGIIMKVLKERDQLVIDNVTEAMEHLLEDGFSDVIIQPTHIINGDEYDKMMAQIEPFRDKFEVLHVGAPLLTTSEDYTKTCEAIMKQFPSFKENEALILMGHGTGHYTDAAYAALDYRFKALGYTNVFVGTVEGYPDFETMLEQVKQFEPERVILMPFMVVAGDHAMNDMAGEEEDSWKSIFEEAGFEVECLMKGIGEFKEIQQIYIEHALDCAKE
ncbi:sirohydrochlorin cobaltochelatase [Clostridium aminobutyricum]|uniref:Sirohydrochlorin cobaltochelatase n=1 Tax=Clostridium aminobutyricum TaxID=33953 RepID=A0A939D647_CLOAM|nr:sirohydrochlorin cobaltochelatase [Clostridium aminobutyricum]MBN7771902.1 sirohydrochlorin cobaltochelatase [Clostridium aminobutyricum]